MTGDPFPRKPLLAFNALVALGVALTLPASLADGGGGAASEIARTVGRWALLIAGVGFGGWRVADVIRHGRRRLRGWGLAPTLASVGAAIYLAVALPVFAYRSGDAHRREEARAAGERAEQALRAFHRRNGRYPGDWGEALADDPSLGDASDVTFVFTRGGDSGYEFHTRAPGATGAFYFSSRAREIEDRAAEHFKRRLDQGEVAP